jgi:hypothetical protein
MTFFLQKICSKHVTAKPSVNRIIQDILRAQFLSTRQHGVFSSFRYASHYYSTDCCLLAAFQETSATTAQSVLSLCSVYINFFSRQPILSLIFKWTSHTLDIDSDWLHARVQIVCKAKHNKTTRSAGNPPAFYNFKMQNVTYRSRVTLSSQKGWISNS